MFQGDGEALRPTIQSSAGSEFAKFSGGSCRNRFCLQNAGVKALNRCERVAVLQTQDRCFFEKELLYCKLTAASAILKGLLRVSFGAVGDWIFLCWKKLFFIGLLCMSWKNSPFPQNKRFSFTESLRTALKSLSFSKPKRRLFEQLFTVCKNRLFTYKNLSFAQAFPCWFQKRPFSQTKSFSFAQTFPYCHPKQSFSALSSPFQPPLTYCLQRIQLFF